MLIFKRRKNIGLEELYILNFTKFLNVSKMLKFLLIAF